MAKIIAFHLPQFHSFPENDKWWGKGFTEWVNVKKAVPLFKGHIQPKVPFEENYYNLLNPEVRKWQAALAQEYGIYGFCYYHYWFNGKKLMEKPLEALLVERNISLPFCFCWANEPWTRAWDGRTSTILMPQEYGNRKEWKEHLDYLMQFFLDERYIKVNNKPMFIIYRTNNIDKCDEMIDFWNSECRKNGFDGIHIVEEYNSFQDAPACNNSEAMVEFEPLFQIRRKHTIKDDMEKIKEHLQGKVLLQSLSSDANVFSYEKVWKDIVGQEFHTDRMVYLGAFVNWDNSPRRGKDGTIALGASPEIFGHYLEIQVKRADQMKSEYIFLNAWNEWAEGAYLEPDRHNGYAYLEAVKRTLDENHE